MKKIIILIILSTLSFPSSAQSLLDSLQDMANHWRRYGIISVEASYMQSIHSSNDIEDYFHQKSSLRLNLEYKRTMLRFGLDIENLCFRNTRSHITPYSYDVHYLTLPVNFQYNIIDIHWAQLFLGVGFELDWIVKYNFTNESNTINHPSTTNPEIGKQMGLRLQLPVTMYFLISEHWRCNVNIMTQIQLQMDHEKPEENNKWGVITPEKELDFGVPLWIGLGLTYNIKSGNQKEY